jgi:DNA-binding SARP family transcriptional activator
LRRALPEAGCFLHADVQTVQWRPDAPFILDVAEFERLIADDRWRMTDDRWSEIRRRPAISYLLSTICHLQAAVDLYRGDLLSGCYDDWIVAERERLHKLCIEALDRLIVLLEGRQDYRTAIGYTQRLVRHEPLDEAAYVRLMRLYTLTGGRVSALRAYQTCVTVSSTNGWPRPTS